MKIRESLKGGLEKGKKIAKNLVITAALIGALSSCESRNINEITFKKKDNIFCTEFPVDYNGARGVMYDVSIRRDAKWIYHGETKRTTSDDIRSSSTEYSAKSSDQIFDRITSELQRWAISGSFATLEKLETVQERTKEKIDFIKRKFKELEKDKETSEVKIIYKRQK